MRSADAPPTVPDPGSGAHLLDAVDPEGSAGIEANQQGHSRAGYLSSLGRDAVKQTLAKKAGRLERGSTTNPQRFPRAPSLDSLTEDPAAASYPTLPGRYPIAPQGDGEPGWASRGA